MRNEKELELPYKKINSKSRDFNIKNIPETGSKENFNNQDEQYLNIHRYNKSSVNFKKYKTTSSFFPQSSISAVSLNFNNRRLMGISEYQSSNSLRNSSYVWSFTRSDRFSGGVYKRPATDSIYKLPDTRSIRFTNQGYGERKDLRPTAGNNSPPPNQYFIRSCFEDNLIKKKGPSILDKIPGLPHPSEKNPGPGTYNIRNSVGLSKGTAVALKSRVMFFYDLDIAKQKHCVSPQKYLPSTKSVENLRFTKIGFGYGERSKNDGGKKFYFIYQFSGKNFVPGPGTYNLPSVFDKKRRMKIPLN